MRITVVIEAKQNPDGYPADAAKFYAKAKQALGSALMELNEERDVLVRGTIEPQRFRGDAVTWALGDDEV